MIRAAGGCVNDEGGGREFALFNQSGPAELSRGIDVCRNACLQTFKRGIMNSLAGHAPVREPI